MSGLGEKSMLLAWDGCGNSRILYDARLLVAF